MPAYLDWNATTPPAPDVLEAMREAMQVAWANPASVHGPGRSARRLVEDARAAVAALLGTDARDVVLTSGGTEANNLALVAPFTANAGLLVVSRIEHPSVLRVAEELERRGIEVAWLDPDPDGRVPVARFEQALARAGGRPTLVSLQAVNHETGVIQPVGEVSDRAHAQGALMHCDAVQAVGRLAPEAWSGADIVTMAAHKIRGPKGIGAVAVRCGIRLTAILRGGAQERGVRPGTQDPVAAAGLTVAAIRARDGASRYASIAALRDALEDRLLARGAFLNGGAARAPHVTNVSFAAWSGPELCAALDLEGVAVSSGSACSAGTADPSPVITAMLGRSRAAGAVRFSLGETTTIGEIDEAVGALDRILARADRSVG